ncbi:hypothetical protein [Actinomadura sp. 9N407]|uniref:hypothetical protein n=1 Tax=Actinomadura sp. 9N407 TaxID=3375154 RepID=UPI0037A1EFDB
MRASAGAPLRGRRIWTQLLRIGWAAGRGAKGDRLRAVALVTATAIVALTATMALAVMAVYSERAARDEKRGPQFVESPNEAVALWQGRYDAIGDVSHQVVFVEPLKLGAPPPPGLARWPAKGEAFLSPELVRAGAHEGIAVRYGRFAGSIGPSGLASPGERFVYVRPSVTDLRSDKWYGIAGFGGGSMTQGESANVQPMHRLLLTLGFLAVLPALALAVVAARCGSATRDRRGALLSALGAGRGHSALINTGEAALPVVVGAALGVLPYGLATAVDVRLPVVGYLLGSDDLRRWAWALPLIAAGVVALVTALVVAVNRTGRPRNATRPRVFTETVPRWRLLLCAGMAAAVVAGGYVSGTAGLYLYIAGTAGLWATLPSVAAALSRRLGSRVAEAGLRTGRPAPLVAGRLTSAHPGVVARLAVTTVVGLGLIVQVQVGVSWLGAGMRDAVATQRRIGDTVTLTASSGMTSERVVDFQRRLPPGFQVLALHVQDEQAPVLTGSCETLRGLRLPCPSTASPVTPADGDARAQELIAWLGAPGRELRVAARSGGVPHQLVVVAARPLEGRSSQVKRAAYAAFPAPEVKRPGEEWLTGAAGHARLGDWLGLFGGIGVLIVMVAAVLSAAAEFLRFCPSLAPLAVLSDRRRLLLSIGLWTLTVPLTVTILVAAGVTVWHGFFFLSLTREGSFSWSVLAFGTTAAWVLAVAVGLAGGASAMRAARRWRPVAD